MEKLNRTSRREFLEKITASAMTLMAMNGDAYGVNSSALILTKNKFKPLESMEGNKKFVPVMITPFQSGLKIDFDALSKLIDFYKASGVKGFFANCLSSEMYYLNAEERLALVKHVVKKVNGAVPIVATGSFGSTNEERAEFTKKMYDTGVNAVILITSHFAKKEESDDTLIKNLEQYFKLTGNIPLGTYECPSPYKRILSPKVFSYLLSTHRIIYHKDTAIDFEKVKAKLDLAKGSSLEFYDAHSPNTMLSLQHGARGMSCIAGNFYPEIFVWMCNNVNDPGKQEEVKWLQSEITRADAIISDGYPLGSKYFLKKRGLPIELICRAENSGLSKTQMEALDKVYQDLFVWRERLGIVM